MSLDTPARIAILGAGPTGLEAALYARFLGYDVDVYERSRVAENLLRLGPQPLWVPWRLVPSPLAVAALEAQDASWRIPAADEMLTAKRSRGVPPLPAVTCWSIACERRPAC
jgi:NADPH-dependent 2,4-dienoyl-CoA reductase/sulfur reductase-like enzyme